MKKKTLIALAIALTLVLGSFQAAFAETGAPTDVTREAVQGVQSAPTVNDELQAEAFAKDLADQVIDGGYGLVDTATLKAMIDNNEKIVIIDTMPEGWWTLRHIPGALCAVVGGGPENGPAFEFQTGEKDALLKTVNEATAKNVKYYWNSKTKKWVTKKPAKKYWKKCSNKKDANYGQKTKTVSKPDKNAKIIVYCGFTKCQRSHQGAKFLTKKGFKNVYRYAGGISAWVCADNPIEGKDVEAPAAE